MRRTPQVTVAVLAAILPLGGCGGSGHGLEADLARMRDHLREGRLGELHAELSRSQAEAVTAGELVSALEDDPELVEELLAMIDRALDDPDVEYRARLTLDDGEEIVLSLVEGTWVFETPVTVFYGQSTPREALTSFVEAYQAGRWDVLATLVPASYQTGDDETVLAESWTDPERKQRVDRLVKVLATHLDDEIVVQGNKAVLTYPEGQVTLLREGGEWVVLDLD
jgi:hypothetical protein